MLMDSRDLDTTSEGRKSPSGGGPTFWVSDFEPNDFVAQPRIDGKKLLTDRGDFAP